MSVLRFDPSRRTNARLIADLHYLGIISESMVTLDATWGEGRWWSDWRPDAMVRCDLHPGRAADVQSDFRAMPFRDGAFDLTCFDPPYAYRGTSRHAMDEGYGLAEGYLPVAARDELILDGIAEAVRVTRRGGVVVVKVQDQVVSGFLRPQSHMAARALTDAGCRLVSVLEVAGGVRPQRSQRTARNNTSQAVVARVGKPVTPDR